MAIFRRNPLTGRRMQIFRQISRFISEMIQDRAIVSVECQHSTGMRTLNSYAIYQIVPFPMTLRNPLT